MPAEPRHSHGASTTLCMPWQFASRSCTPRLLRQEQSDYQTLPALLAPRWMHQEGFYQAKYFILLLVEALYPCYALCAARYPASQAGSQHSAASHCCCLKTDDAVMANCRRTSAYWAARALALLRSMQRRLSRFASRKSSLLSEGKLCHEGDVVRGPVLVGQPRVLGLLHCAVLWQVQQRHRDQRLMGVEDVVQGALEVLAHICPLHAGYQCQLTLSWCFSHEVAAI